MRILFSALVLFLSFHRASAQWEPLGPAGEEIRAFAAQDSFLFAAARNALYRSSDGGGTWTEIPKPASTSYHDLHVSGAVLTVACDWGVYISMDHGATWAEPVVSPSRHAAQCLASAQSVLFASSNDGVLRSVDQGATWNLLPGTDSIAQSRAMTGFATGSVGTMTTSLFATGWGKGLWRSTDLGFSWVRADAGIRHLRVTTIHPFTYLLFIGGKIQTRGYVYAGTEDSSVWVSADHGTSWSRVGPGIEGRYVQSLVAAGGVFGDTLLAGTMDGVFMHTAGDSLWRRANAGIPATWVQALKRIGNGIIAGALDGAYVSTDCGLHWNGSSRGMNGSNRGRLAVSGSALFAGNFGLIRRTFAGGTWAMLHHERTEWGGINDIDAGWGSRVYYVSVLDSGFWQSTDNGATWSFGGRSMNTRWRSITHNVARSRLYAGTIGGVLASTNNGASWTKVGGTTFPAGVEVSMVRTNTTGPITTVFAGANGDLYYSENDGDTWVRRTLPNDYVNNSYPSVEDVLVAGTRWIVISGYPNSFLVRSTNYGAKWDTLHPPFNMDAMAYASPHLFVLGGSSLAVSDDYGSTWKSLPSPGYYAGPRSLAVSGDTLYVSTNAGIVRQAISRLVTSVHATGGSEPVTFGLLPNFPNPFNPSTTIRYTLQGRAHVTLAVYNALGQQVAVLRNEEQSAGYHEVTFEAAGLSSGAYFCRLQAGGLVATRSLLLVR